MISFLILDYNRPIESELCLASIRKFAHFPYDIVYLSNGGKQSYVMDFYDKGLIDKLILRKKNSGCGLGTRELFNDFNLENDYVIYVQCDQFLCRDFEQIELQYYLDLLESNKYLYIDLAGNQGHGQYSERAHLINKFTYKYNQHAIGGPGPYADHQWTENHFQEFIKKNGYKFFSAKPILFADNGKLSIREYPCGGVLLMMTDTKAVSILKPISKRVNFPNIHLTDEEWDLILSNKWVNGTIPVGHTDNSFTCWQEPLDITILKK